MLFYLLPVLEIEKLTSDAVCISFGVADELREIFTFTQGQYITLKTTINNAEVRRSYSICSSVQSGQLQVGIKMVENGLFSSFANTQLKVGDVLEVSPPNGKFYVPLQPENKKHYLGIAAGSGITPILSILASTLYMEPFSTFTLVYSNKNRQTIMFKEALEALKNKYLTRLQLINIFSQEKIDTPLFCGRINAEKCIALSKSVLNLSNINEAFLCGPEEMVLDVKNYLLEIGLPIKNVHVELFGTSQKTKKIVHVTTKETVGKICKLSIIKDGNTMQIDLPFETISVLDAALQNHADMPFACKGGVCCTCKARITKGQVYMDVNYGLEPDEIEAGFVLTCQSYPKTEAVVINFDDV